MANAVCQRIELEALAMAATVHSEQLNRVKANMYAEESQFDEYRWYEIWSSILNWIARRCNAPREVGICNPAAQNYDAPITFPSLPNLTQQPLSTPAPLRTRSKTLQGLQTLNTTETEHNCDNFPLSPLTPLTDLPLPKILTSDDESDNDIESLFLPLTLPLSSFINPRPRSRMIKEALKPLAEVKIGKLKDCPILSTGCIDPLVLQTWTLACKWYMKHSEKKASEIVSFIIDSMMEPRLIAWYNMDQTCMDALTLASYLTELAALGDCEFIDWKIEVENLNTILTTSAPTQALKAEALKNQLEANLNEDLLTNLLNEPAISTDLAAWTLEVKEWDDWMCVEDEHTQCLIHVNESACSFCRIEKKTLLSHLSDPQPPRTHHCRLVNIFQTGK
ncbi:hypothetical protein M422DRAFT_256807 [Sphaerobolus stellatus SS14]|uniref:Uncharacterized protein n=1 Tax=Sphaerobolus stellatus (strain SS14) TaxID=990650 RepID=A0A0C9VQT8_SPHS4|nr:hypothetical protein M422DRAFT_256807 [Sphaerobolus stellatus SS14]